MVSLSLLVCLIGLLTFFVATRKKFADSWFARVGELSFFAGLLAFLIQVGMKTLL